MFHYTFIYYVVGVSIIAVLSVNAFCILSPTKLKDGLVLAPKQFIYRFRRDQCSPNLSSCTIENVKENVKPTVYLAAMTTLYSWLQGEEKERNSTKKNRKTGTVIRTAAKPFSITSKASSLRYSTNKDSKIKIDLTPEGVIGDYNHYRKVALKDTTDRAISILTSDILHHLHKKGYTTIREGDLGENIYVDGVDHFYFQIGKRYIFQTTFGNNSNENLKQNGVVVEITEPIIPCPNLCRLSLFNHGEPAERVKRCQSFLKFLDQREGFRGWYAKVIGTGGTVKIGDSISELGHVEDALDYLSLKLA